MIYYHDGDNEVGPFSAENLKKLADTGLITDRTLVRPEGDDRWIAYGRFTGDGSDAGGSGAKRVAQAADAMGAPAEPPAPARSQYISETGWFARPPTPWRRYGARLLDTTLNGTVGFILIAVALFAIAPQSAEKFFAVFETGGGIVLDLVVTALIAAVLGGLMIGVTGFTVGKLIFGVKVTRADGSVLGVKDGLGRDLTVLVKGLGLGIPIVALVTMWVGYKTLTDNEEASWDEGRYVVWHRPGGTLQSLLNIVGILLIIGLSVAVKAVAEL